MEEEGKGSSQKHESLDFLSDHFDPLRALYTEDLQPPIPNIQIFNNIGEYALAIKEGKAKSQPSVPARETVVEPNRRTRNLKPEFKPPDIASRLQAIAQKNEKEVLDVGVKAQFLSERPAERTLGLRTSEKRWTKKYKNVIERMDECVTGPFSILYKCLKERLKVQVWIRKYKGLRSVLTGFVIAFDKHMNLALMDVDELYTVEERTKRPQTEGCKTTKKKKKKKRKKKKNEIGEQKIEICRQNENKPEGLHSPCAGSVSFLRQTMASSSLDIANKRVSKAKTSDLSSKCANSQQWFNELKSTENAPELLPLDSHISDEKQISKSVPKDSLGNEEESDTVFHSTLQVCSVTKEPAMDPAESESISDDHQLDLSNSRYLFSHDLTVKVPANDDDGSRDMEFTLVGIFQPNSSEEATKEEGRSAELSKDLDFKIPLSYLQHFASISNATALESKQEMVKERKGISFESESSNRQPTWPNLSSSNEILLETTSDSSFNLDEQNIESIDVVKRRLYDMSENQVWEPPCSLQIGTDIDALSFPGGNTDNNIGHTVSSLERSDSDISKGKANTNEMTDPKSTSRGVIFETSIEEHGTEESKLQALTPLSELGSKTQSWETDDLEKHKDIPIICGTVSYSKDEEISAEQYLKACDCKAGYNKDDSMKGETGRLHDGVQENSTKKMNDTSELHSHSVELAQPTLENKVEDKIFAVTKSMPNVTCEILKSCDVTEGKTDPIIAKLQTVDLSEESVLNVVAEDVLGTQSGLLECITEEKVMQHDMSEDAALSEEVWTDSLNNVTGEMSVARVDALTKVTTMRSDSLEGVANNQSMLDDVTEDKLDFVTNTQSSSLEGVTNNQSILHHVTEHKTGFVTKLESGSIDNAIGDKILTGTMQHVKEVDRVANTNLDDMVVIWAEKKEQLKVVDCVTDNKLDDVAIVQRETMQQLTELDCATNTNSVDMSIVRTGTREQLEIGDYMTGSNLGDVATVQKETVQQLKEADCVRNSESNDLAEVQTETMIELKEVDCVTDTKLDNDMDKVRTKTSSHDKWKEVVKKSVEGNKNVETLSEICLTSKEGIPTDQKVQSIFLRKNSDTKAACYGEMLERGAQKKNGQENHVRDICSPKSMPDQATQTEGNITKNDSEKEEGEITSSSSDEEVLGPRKDLETQYSSKKAKKASVWDRLGCRKTSCDRPSRGSSSLSLDGKESRNSKNKSGETSSRERSSKHEDRRKERRNSIEKKQSYEILRKEGKTFVRDKDRTHDTTEKRRHSSVSSGKEAKNKRETQRSQRGEKESHGNRKRTERSKGRISHQLLDTCQHENKASPAKEGEKSEKKKHETMLEKSKHESSHKKSAYDRTSDGKERYVRKDGQESRVTENRGSEKSIKVVSVKSSDTNDKKKRSSCSVRDEKNEEKLNRGTEGKGKKNAKPSYQSGKDTTMIFASETKSSVEKVKGAEHVRTKVSKQHSQNAKESHRSRNEPKMALSEKGQTIASDNRERKQGSNERKCGKDMKKSGYHARKHSFERSGVLRGTSTEKQQPKKREVLTDKASKKSSTEAKAVLPKVDIELTNGRSVSCHATAGKANKESTRYKNIVGRKSNVETRPQKAEERRRKETCSSRHQSITKHHSHIREQTTRKDISEGRHETKQDERHVKKKCYSTMSKGHSSQTLRSTDSGNTKSKPLRLNTVHAGSTESGEQNLSVTSTQFSDDSNNDLTTKTEPKKIGLLPTPLLTPKAEPRGKRVLGTRETRERESNDIERKVGEISVRREKHKLIGSKKRKLIQERNNERITKRQRVSLQSSPLSTQEQASNTEPSLKIQETQTKQQRTTVGEGEDADKVSTANRLEIGKERFLTFKKRHVNQLFIRGDNVVMVSYAT